MKTRKLTPAKFIEELETYTIVNDRSYGRRAKILYEAANNFWHAAYQSEVSELQEIANGWVVFKRNFFGRVYEAFEPFPGTVVFSVAVYWPWFKQRIKTIHIFSD